MNKTILAIMIALILILGIGFISAVVYATQEFVTGDKRVRVVYAIEENTEKTVENPCMDKNCFVYPSVQQERQEPCEQPRQIVCHEGCYNPLVQEQGQGYYQNIPQEKKNCDI